MLIEITLPASGERLAIEANTIVRLREVHRSFGGRWGCCELVVKGSRFHFWAEQTYSEVLAAIRAAEAGQQIVAREPDGDVVSDGLQATPQKDPPI